MHQWNEQQPGGQGLAADFDVYFKGLSDMDKVVSSFTHARVDADPSPHPTQRFKKEMHTGTAQGAMRKAKQLPNSPAKRHQQPYVGAREQIPVPTPLPSHCSSQAPQPPDPSCLRLYRRLGQFYFYSLSLCIHTCRQPACLILSYSRYSLDAVCLGADATQSRQPACG
ncbi:hypothetical protein EDB84DRAFT_1488305, partial [Lactarius hengduanensis]